MSESKSWPTTDSLAELVSVVKEQIETDTFASEEDAWEGTPNGILLTIGADGRGGWNYQTGDTSFMGGAYGYPYWGSVEVYRSSHPRNVANRIRGEIFDRCAEARTNN